MYRRFDLEIYHHSFFLYTLPDKLILKLLSEHSNLSNHDHLNCVIVSKRYQLEVELGDYARLVSHNKFRTAQVLGLDINYNNIYIGHTLHHNLVKDGITKSARVCLMNASNIRVANEVEICINNSRNDFGNLITDTILKNYFLTPKIIRMGDILTINIQTYAPEFIVKNLKIKDDLYVKCTKINGSREFELPYFCVFGKTTVKQSAHVMEFIPRKEQIISFQSNNIENVEENLNTAYPEGFQTRFSSLEKAITPFLKKKKLKLSPIFLIHGNKGSGKNFLVQALADKLGLSVYKDFGNELSLPTYTQTETLIKNTFLRAKLSAPCIFILDNFESFGKNSEGQFDLRIVNYLKTQLQTLQSSLNPVILICLSNSKDLQPDCSRIFLETFDFGSLNQEERCSVLEWLIKVQFGIQKDVDCNDISGKTHGFLFEDLKALVYYSYKNAYEKNRNEMISDDFYKALDILQANYTESLGAPKVPKVQWSDVGGLTDVKEEIIKTINLPLKHPKLLKTSGLKRSGILLYGPPGTGKTLIAKAVATECGLCFLSVKGPELLNMYVGQSEQNVREVFERAREASPCIIFFDELDSLAPNRGLSGDSGGVMDRVVSQLLSEMDGLNEEATIFIIGATNRPDLIDPALLRPGRFDKLLYVGPAQDVPSKTSVLKALTRKFNLDEDVNLENIVEKCPKNISGADFYGLCSSAWLSAVRRLIKKIEEGRRKVEELSHEDVIVNSEDFKVAAKTIKPSISPKDLMYFEKLKLEFSAKK
ncbi:peroxisomal ATPase PEX6 isoform X2 [Onthophagus taurus]|uniref:peroxisomal ATPase PEX6 isoform X2 n=1 Tax=Onthophagus taurus TaxID=166361 RepID=UPI0039BDE115